MQICAANEKQIGTFEAVLSEALGEGGAEGGARDLTDFVIAEWHGSLLRIKVERSPAALHQFRRLSTTGWID